jgi:hypothetical protein
MTPKNTGKVLQLICGLFIFLFVYTALSKFHEFTSFKLVLFRSPLIGRKSAMLAWILPIVELLVALLLFFPRARWLGLYSSFFLMSTFTIYLAYMIAFTPHLPCSCGGVLKQMSWKQHVYFNLIFTMLALLGIFLERRSHVPRESKKQKTVFT